jgi:hypothetical protein
MTFASIPLAAIGQPVRVRLAPRLAGWAVQLGGRAELITLLGWTVTVLVVISATAGLWRWTVVNVLERLEALEDAEVSMAAASLSLEYRTRGCRQLTCDSVGL